MPAMATTGTTVWSAPPDRESSPLVVSGKLLRDRLASHGFALLSGASGAKASFRAKSPNSYTAKVAGYHPHWRSRTVKTVSRDRHDTSRQSQRKRPGFGAVLGFEETCRNLPEIAFERFPSQAQRWMSFEMLLRPGSCKYF